jgi:hypothetical protein
VSADRLIDEHFCYSGRQLADYRVRQLNCCTFLPVRWTTCVSGYKLTIEHFCQSEARKQEIKSMKMSEPQAKYLLRGNVPDQKKLFLVIDQN